ncbi:MAG: hypothetical protein ACTHJ8_08860 [Mucilaginibacter sp.]|jgi:5-methylcytosine-specific restriction endonuclease McrA
MHRHFSHLDEKEQKFIDCVYIQLKTFQQTAEELGVDISKIRNFNEKLDSTWRPITAIRNKWKAKQIEGNFWDFYNWVMTTQKACNYCGITEEELNRLHTIGINNKRPTRGKTLEIDRKIADEPYSNLENLVYCCYWCNNAKTDTFSEEEFKIIGKAISQVWKQRLNNDHR